MKRDSLKTMAAIALVLIGVSAAFAQSGLSIHTAQPARFTIPPKVFSPITMKTVPQATCVLHPTGVTDDEHRLRLFADDEGIVRFHLSPEAESEGAARFQIDCAAAGKIKIFPLQLRFSSSATADRPAAVAQVARTRPEAYVRPPLSEDDALQLSTEELEARGYPGKPDVQQTPEAFATWLRSVTRPATYVPSRVVANPHVIHDYRQGGGSGSGKSSNWSGYQLHAGFAAFYRVMGSWHVPQLSFESGYHTYSSVWVGIDGDSSSSGFRSSDLVQVGTEQDAADFYTTTGKCCPVALIHVQAVTDYAFTEAFDDFTSLPKGEQVIPNLSVNVGDSIFAEIIVGNPNVTLLIENLSRSAYTTVLLPIGRDIGSYTAEWIMERPTVNGALPDLADYSLATLNSAFAWNPDRGWVSYGTDLSGWATAEQISMYNTVCSVGGILSSFQCKANLLSSPRPLNGTDMQFVWSNFH